MTLAFWTVRRAIPVAEPSRVSLAVVLVDGEPL